MASTSPFVFPTKKPAQKKRPEPSAASRPTSSAATSSAASRRKQLPAAHGIVLPQVRAHSMPWHECCVCQMSHECCVCQMSQFLDGLGAQHTSWKKSLSRYEVAGTLHLLCSFDAVQSKPLADSEPGSAASSARPSTACRPVQRQRSKSRCNSVSGSRVSRNAAPIIGKQATN